MKKKKILIGLTFMIFGFLIAVQGKTITNIIGDESTVIARNRQLIETLNTSNKEKEKLSKELDAIEGKILEYKNTQAKEDSTTQGILKEIAKYRNYIGYENVEGPGVILTLDRGQIYVEEDSLEDYNYNSDHILKSEEVLLSITNIINGSYAEALAINDIRYTYFSSFTKKDDELYLDGLKIELPIVIKAIGDPDLIERDLRFEDDIVYYLINQTNSKVMISQKDHIEIPRYNREVEFKYAEPIR